MAGMAAKPGKMILVAFRVETDTKNEAIGLVKKGVETGWWDERVKEHRMVSLPKPKKCRHQHTVDIEREEDDWLKGKARHWRETIYRDCGATVTVSSDWYD